jgi:hypothetical protein
VTLLIDEIWSMKYRILVAVLVSRQRFGEILYGKATKEDDHKVVKQTTSIQVHSFQPKEGECFYLFDHFLQDQQKIWRTFLSVRSLSSGPAKDIRQNQSCKEPQGRCKTSVQRGPEEARCSERSTESHQGGCNGVQDFDITPRSIGGSKTLVEAASETYNEVDRGWSGNGSGVPPTFSDFWCASSGAVKHFPDKPLSSSPDRTTANMH